MTLFLMAGVLTLIYVTLIWLLSLWRQNSSIMDIFWGSGFVLVNGFYFLSSDGNATRQALLMALVALWGVRLSLYIGWRNGSKPEDFRYAKWRREAGAAWWWRSFFKVFLLQGTILWLLSTPLLIGQTSDARLSILDMIGAMVWLVGFGFEAVGDWQLAQFKANPTNKGKVMDRGLWRYTRHPNYFGEAVLWWGFGLMALAAGGWWSLYSPVLMTYLLVRVSGVPLLEADMVKNKPGYAAYVRKTNGFVPGLPKKDSHH